MTGAHSEQGAENIWSYRSKGKRNSTDTEENHFSCFLYIVLCSQIPEMAIYWR